MTTRMTMEIPCKSLNPINDITPQQIQIISTHRHVNQI
jgi:ABC-type microcin C transport system duplicated ATPase subunit YejF